MSKFYGFALVAAFLAFAQSSLMAQTSDPKPGLVLVEAESFADKGGWGVDTLSNDVLGSSYLIAHGWGTPVADAKTTVKFPGPGKYQVYVRTHNWVEPWTKEHAPGRFQLAIDGKVMATEFGTKSGGWAWQEGDLITVAPDKLASRSFGLRRARRRDLLPSGRLAGGAAERSRPARRVPTRNAQDSV